ncbi:hypothetical protein D3C77_401440 [compost metagenome]
MYFYNSLETYESLERARKFESEGNKLTFDTEIESIYIVGAFGVASASPFEDGERSAVYTSGSFTLTELPESVLTGDLVPQGFPFFAGSIRLQQTVFLDWEAWTSARWDFKLPSDAIVSRLYINDQEVRTFVWEPYEADITPYLRQGHNCIELELVNSCRNLLGPHHHIKGEVYKIGPDSFTDKAGWTDKDLDPNTQVYQDRYAFVRFGLYAVPHIYLSK